MASQNQNYYINPAFCQKSEFIHQKYKNTSSQPVSPDRRALSPEKRQSPVGAYKQTTAYEIYHSPPKPGPKPKIIQRNNSIQIRIQDTRNGNEYEEQFEEMLVDDHYLDTSNGNVTNNKKIPKHRYEYIPMQEQANGYPSSPRKSTVNYQEDIETIHGRIHRYAMIPDEEEPQQNLQKERYALVPVSDLKPNMRYEVIPQEDTREIISKHRYEYIQDDIDNRYYQESNSMFPLPNRKVAITSPQTPKKKGNPIATQKLHELLNTPKKSTPQRKVSSTPKDPFCTPTKPATLPKPSKQLTTPKAQQKLNYTLSTRHQNQQPNFESKQKRHTAVITPICSSPIQSVYSETTFSNKSESWMNLSVQKPPIQATLGVAAFMMIMCGGLTSALCFYMVSVVGRMYYLDFGTISGFACLLLGLLGFRSRNCHWLPNRNYISGYIVLSAFSLLTCAGLLVLLFLQPKPGSPLADVTSGAVCGISGLSLILASTGVIASYCCKYPPPDNRVQHCAPGFTV